MSTQQVVADRYAQAVFQAAQAAGAIEAVDSDLAEVTRLLKSEPDFNRLWMHPVVEVADKQQLVRQLFGGKAHPLSVNLLLLMFDKKRGVLVENVQKAYRELFNATRRLATVKVTSAMALDDVQMEALRAQLAQQLAKEIQMETAVDPALVGGMVLQIEDQVIDNSLRGRLEALRNSLN